MEFMHAVNAGLQVRIHNQAQLLEVVDLAVRGVSGMIVEGIGP